jgi:hypothetical protein
VKRHPDGIGSWAGYALGQLHVSHVPARAFDGHQPRRR